MSQDAAGIGSPPDAIPAAGRGLVLTYCGMLLLLLALASPYEALIGLPITFFLKNKLHLSANEVAQFNVIAAIPLFLGFVPGMIRDRWNPFGFGDRGLLAIFGLLTSVLYGAVAFIAPVYAALLAAALLITASVQVAWAAARGLTADIGQQNAMAGQVSMVMNMASIGPNLLAYLLGGMLSGWLEGSSATTAARILFLVGAGLMLAVALSGAFGPRRVFQYAPRTRPVHSLSADIARIARHWPIYPALGIYLLWQFAPAGGVALQFHMANALRASDAQVGQFYAIFMAGFLPMLAAYGWICQRVRLRTLLWWGTILAVLQWTPILFAHTPGQALLAAIPIGLMGGLGQAAYVDLAIRSCPLGLQGTMAQMLVGAYWVSYRFGDLWGAYIYDHQGGFRMAVWATVAVYACIIPLLLLVPKRLTATSDGEAILV